MKRGPLCPGCRFYMHVEEGEYVCPECGHAEPVESVQDVVTPQPAREVGQVGVRPDTAHAWFEKMRQAVDQ
jgi:uncharacterized Zn finger protein (UPF0148 family)